MALSAVWIEFPVKDLERALKFYQALFGCDADIVDDGERKTATITNYSESHPLGISLNQTANFEPSNKGAYVYLTTGDDDLSATLAKVAGAGGKALTGKISMGAAGHYATVQDTEGNVFGLYSPNKYSDGNQGAVMAENQQLEPYYDYLKQLEARLADQLDKGWQTRVGYFPPTGQANNVSIALFKSNWFNDISDGIHFETWFGKADIERRTFPVALHVEASKAKTGLQRGVFNQYVLENAGDKLATWVGYSTSPKSYQLLIARLPYETASLVEQMLNEYQRLISLAAVIDAAIVAAT